MNTIIQKPALKKLFDNKYFTYVMNEGSLRGSIMEVEIKVVGKRVQLVYKKLREHR